MDSVPEIILNGAIGLFGLWLTIKLIKELQGLLEKKGSGDKNGKGESITLKSIEREIVNIFTGFQRMHQESMVVQNQQAQLLQQQAVILARHTDMLEGTRAVQEKTLDMLETTHLNVKRALDRQLTAEKVTDILDKKLP